MLKPVLALQCISTETDTDHVQETFLRLLSYV